ncbi:hypothetical protein SDC9_118676 [bioreactor metagenome]|uniref:Uncharacterized protein n=1 Tax=bioreactor metagenome TaxID=1076179 RepID=A0A645C1M3_9ZZZZ
MGQIAVFGINRFQFEMKLLGCIGNALHPDIG